MLVNEVSEMDSDHHGDYGPGNVRCQVENDGSVPCYEDSKDTFLWSSRERRNWNSSINEYYENTTGQTTATPLPREMTFNDDSLVSVIAYVCLFVVAASGNLTVFIALFRSRRIKSRVNLFIMHLSIADLIVAFIMLPLETAWNVTVSWQAGDVACRIMMFFRAFGFYLSSSVLVTISLDRYFSIVHPLSLHDADRRGKIMITLAWILSTVASLPQVGTYQKKYSTLFIIETVCTSCTLSW